MRCMTVPRILLATYSRLLARLLLTAFPSPSVASWGMQCSAGAATSHPSQASTSPPFCCTTKRTLAGCRASRRAVQTGDGWVAHPHSWSKFSFPHLMLTSVAPCAVLPLHPARPRRRGLNRVRRTDGAAREWLSWLWRIIAFSLV